MSGDGTLAVSVRASGDDNLVVVLVVTVSGDGTLVLGGLEIFLDGSSSERWLYSRKAPAAFLQVMKEEDH